MSADHLLLFTRYPTPGVTKTRLISRLGPEGAADLQEWLTGRSVLAGKCWAEDTGGQLKLLTTGALPKKFKNWLGREISVHPQTDGDLGQRLDAACRDAFTGGAERVALMGIDCPGLGPEQIREAFQILDQHHAGVIPATDGGYVLLTLREYFPQLFDGIPWGGPDVLEATRDRGREADLSMWTGKPLSDVDEPGDLSALPAWRQDSEQISVVIPALNEESHIVAAVKSAIPGASEVVVADGGSTDGTVNLARNAGARVIQAPRGRGPQLNAGAREARNGILLFLHADCVLPDGYADIVRDVLTRPRVGLGGFPLRIGGDRPALRWVERGIHLRSTWRRRPYGDQGLFLTRDLFERVSGFPSIPLLEDLELVKRIAKRRRVALGTKPIQCSARRWESRGVVKTTLTNQVILAAHALGVSPQTLVAWYTRRRS